MIVVKWRSDPGAPGPVAAGGGGTSSSGDWEVSGVDPQSARTELRPRVKRGVRVKLLQGLTKLRDLEVPFSRAFEVICAPESSPVIVDAAPRWGAWQ